MKRIESKINTASAEFQANAAHNRALIAAGTGPHVGIYNLADDDPSPMAEVADDVALGQMLKRSGARPTVLDATGFISQVCLPDLTSA